MNASAGLARLKLRCGGTVQGVGFRPAVLRLGRSLNLVGSVRNVVAGVELELVGDRPGLQHFLERLPGALPAAARLEQLEIAWLEAPPPGCRPTDLQIPADDPLAPERPLGAGWLAPGLRADRAPCRACWLEFSDPHNRRHRDPFIGCCDCGPRYAISHALPFLRRHTSLQPLPLCRSCRLEAADPANRRFHCETISCPACGPQLRWIGDPPPGDPLERALELLRQGGILALQGIAGFQLLVDAANRPAIQRLRQRKGRPHQPLALLVNAIDRLERSVGVSPAERRLLQHQAAPIVLLQRSLQDPEGWPGVADRAPTLGVMLPASGLHRLLAEGHGGPLVATSANGHGEPMWITPAQAEAGLGTLADGVLLHDRAIMRPLDDSVAQVIEGRPRVLRRARGYAPEPLRLPAAQQIPADQGPVLALGADLRCAPALAVDGRVWLAAPFGSLDHPTQQHRLEAAVREVLASHPGVSQAMVCDAHPGSRSAALAQRLSRPCQRVAHHQAHGLAVLAEHGLGGPVLLLCADGVGVDPEDRRPIARGCELLLVPTGQAAIRRLGQLLPFPLPGSDLACREPRRAALGLLAAIDPALIQHPGARSTRRAFETGELSLLCSALRAGVNSPACSSLGRLFDGVASLLGLVQALTFEGQGGLWIEGAAARGSASATDRSGAGDGAMVAIRSANGLLHLDWRPWLRGCLERLAAGESPQDLAACFQISLARGLVELVGLGASVQQGAGMTPGVGVSDRPIVSVALAGGCFQNAALLQQSAALLRRRGLQPWWSEQVPCHDGGLALGQLAAWRRQFCRPSPPAGRCPAP